MCFVNTCVHLIPPHTTHINSPCMGQPQKTHMTHMYKLHALCLYYTHTHMHTYTHIHTHAHTHTHTHAHTHMHTHICTHTHTHTHTHTVVYLRCRPLQRYHPSLGLIDTSIALCQVSGHSKVTNLKANHPKAVTVI